MTDAGHGEHMIKRATLAASHDIAVQAAKVLSPPMFAGVAVLHTFWGRGG